MALPTELKGIYTAADCSDTADCIYAIKATHIAINALEKQGKPVLAAIRRLNSLSVKLAQLTQSAKKSTSKTRSIKPTKKTARSTKPTKTTARETKAVQNKFNTLAVRLGSRARIGGTARKMELQEFLGWHTADGFEVVQKIDMQRFSVLIAKYPELSYLDN